MARSAAPLQFSEALRPAALSQKVSGERRAQAVTSEGRRGGRCQPRRDRSLQAGKEPSQEESERERGMDGEIHGMLAS